MDEISNYEYGVLIGTSPRELKSINVCEPVTVKKYPANIGNLLWAEQGEQIRKKVFLNVKSGLALPRSNEVEIFSGSFNEGAGEKEVNGIYGKEYGPENKIPSREKKKKKEKTCGLMGNNGAGSGGKKPRVVQTWK
jgi:hypothetical protein